MSVDFLARKGVGLAAWIAAGCAFALYAFSVWFGSLNQDEGWYLYAASMVSSSKMLYRDFFFTQGPVLPAVYGALHGLWMPWGVLGGRLFTAALGLAGCLCTAVLAGRAVRRERASCAAVIAFALTACNLYHVYFTTIPKTYALGALLLLAGFTLLTACCPREGDIPRFAPVCAFGAGFLIAAGSGTRISLILLLPVTAVALLMSARKTGLAWLWFGLGGTLGVLLIYGLPLLQAPSAFLFSQTFHVSRSSRNMMLAAGSLSRIVRGYSALCLAASAVIVWKLCRGAGSAAPQTRCPASFWRWVWLAGGAAVFLFQLTSPHPYDDYQVPVMGLFVAAVAAWAAELAETRESGVGVCLAGVLASCLVSFGSPMAQDWFVVRQDRFWTVMQKKSDLALLREAGRTIKALAPDGGTLVTQDAYLAVETGMRLPSGLEMGPFSYFPELNDAAAVSNHVVNAHLLGKLLDSAPGPVCAYSGYSWAIRSPVTDPVPDAERRLFLDAIDRHYTLAGEMPDFGQNKTLLRILKRKE